MQYRVTVFLRNTAKTELSMGERERGELDAKSAVNGARAFENILEMQSVCRIETRAPSPPPILCTFKLSELQLCFEKAAAIHFIVPCLRQSFRFVILHNSQVH